jgi:Hydrazine synthase alpha subunit middle domain
VPRRKIRINRAFLLSMALAALCLPGALCATAPPDAAKRDPSLAYIYTLAPQYDAKAWLDGRDRFPQGAKLVAVMGGMVRLLVPGFYASADAAVSYDAARVLFSGKRTPADHWQVFELDLQGGSPRQLTHTGYDCIRPLYLPDPADGFVYSRGDALEIGGKPTRITFVPGRYLTDDVLRDGRILFEINRGPASRELFTVYPDGTGVESLRCDHGPDRGAARQLASGDYIFISANRLARITSAYAHQLDIPQPDRVPAGPVAEVSPGFWLVSLRHHGQLGLFGWNTETGKTTPLETPPDASAVEPVAIARRIPPRIFPSALLPTRTAGNLLCLNARTSRTPMDGTAVHSVRVYSPAGLLGQTEVEPDGSFYIQVPPDRPIRLELADAAGLVIQAERNWFWMRPAEQRICVGCHTGPERAPENKVPDILLKTIVPVKMLEVQP